MVSLLRVVHASAAEMQRSRSEMMDRWMGAACDRDNHSSIRHNRTLKV